MQHLKFFTLLRTLDENEIVLFQKYLKRLHGNDDIALSVFDYVKKFYPHFRDEKKLRKDFVYRKIFGTAIDDNEYNRKKLLNAMSDLRLWLKAFILSERANDGSFESRFLWLTVLKERGLESEFSKNAASLQTELENFDRESVMDYWKSSAVNHLFYEHFTQDVGFPQSTAFHPFVHNLDLYYAVTKLKIACEVVNLKNMGHADAGSTALLKLPEIPTFSGISDHPLLLLYQAVYQLLSTLRDKHYANVEALLTEHAGKIAPAELDVLLTYMRNYASSLVRKGEKQLWTRIHLLNQLGAKYGAFRWKRKISATQFHNIVNAASKVKDFSWADSFIASHRDFLPENIRTVAEPLANGILLFEQKEFEKIIEILEGVNARDLHLFIRLKTMMLRCYYELDRNENDILDYCIAGERALKRFRKPHLEAVVATFNFIRLLKILIRKRTSRNIVLNDIENTKPLFFKSWLLEKAAFYKSEFASRISQK